MFSIIQRSSSWKESLMDTMQLYLLTEPRALEKLIRKLISFTFYFKLLILFLTFL